MKSNCYVCLDLLVILQPFCNSFRSKSDIQIKLSEKISSLDLSSSKPFDYL